MAQTYKTGLIITGDASGGIRAIKATEDELGKLNQRFDRGSRRSKQFNQSVNATSQGLAALRRAAAPIAGAIAGMFAANTLQGQINWADQLQKTNLRIGASTEALSQYNYVASLSGVEFNQLTTAWQRQTRRIAEAAAGTGVAVAALDRLNLSAQELNQLAPEDQFERIAEAMQGVESSSERVRLAQQLWDSEGVKLVQIVNSGTDAIASMRAEADALGLTISQQTANAMAGYNDEVDRLKFAAQGVSQTIAGALIPSLTSGLQATNRFISAFRSGEMETTERVLRTTAGAATGVAAAVGPQRSLMVVTAQPAWAAHAAQVAVNRAMAANPFILAATAVAGLAGALYASRDATIEMGDTNARVQDWLRASWQETAGQVSGAMLAAYEESGDASSSFLGQAVAVSDGVWETHRALMGNMASITHSSVNSIIAYFHTIGDVMAIVGSSIWQQFRDAFSNTLRIAGGFWQDLQAIFDGDLSFSNFKNAMTAAIQAPLEGMAGEIRAAFDENFNRNYLGELETAITAPFSSLGESISDTAFRMRFLKNDSGLVAEGFSDVRTESGKTNSALQDFLDALDDSTDAANTAAAASREAAKQTTSLANSYENLLDRIQPNRRAARQYAQDVGTLNLALATGRINAVQYMQAMGMLQESFQAAQRETESLADATERAAFTMEGAWDEVRLNGLRRLDDGIANMWQNAIDGSLDAGEAMKRIFNQTLAEMAHMAITRPIMVQIAGSMGMGGGGVPGIGGGFGGINLNSLGSLGNTVSGWFGGGAAAGAPPIGYASGFGAQAATGTYTGWAGSAAAGAANPGMLASMGGFSGIASGLGAGYMGYQLGQSLAPDAKYGKVAGGLGALGGFALGGPIGAAIGGAIVPAISKGLFGGSWQTKEAGLQLGVSSGEFVGNQYERQRKSGGLFRGSSYRTQISALDAELEASLSQTYEAQELALRASLETLGQQSDALNSFSAGLQKISTKGKSEAEIEQAVQEWLQGIVNRAAQSVVDPGDFALAGETTVDTLNRLATALTGVNPIMEQLHGNAFAASLAGGDAAASLVALSGGMDLFIQRADYYYQNFYSETERQQAAMDQAAQAMGEFTAQTGKIVTSADQLRDLVDGIDRNTQSGRELYAAAMQLAPALVEVENGLERVKDRFADMLSEAESALGSAEQQARSAWQAFDRQAFGQQIKLLEMAGDSTAALALQRERELLSIDPLLHETQRFIWAMEDEASAKQAATQASVEAARATQRYISELSQFAGTLGSISQWVDQQNASGGSPGTNLGEAQAQFARQLVMAENGDRNALQSITQYADQVLQANQAYNASGATGQRIRDDVMGALEGLPDAISDAEFIVEGFRGIVSSEMAREIERAIFSSRYKIDTLIEFAADASGLPADLRTILGEQAHRLDSTINYLLGENQLDNELRQLALLATNNLVSTVDYITGSTLSTSDKMLALSSSNTMTSVIDFVLGSDLDRASRILALESSNKYTSMIDMILGRNLRPDDRRLALDSSNRYASLIDYVVRSEITGGNRRLALSSLNEYDALIDYATRKNVSSDDRKLALDNGNRYLSTMDYIVGSKIDSGSRTMALNSSNRYLSTLNFLLGRDITGDDRTLALDTANRFDASIRYIVQSPLTGGERRLALNSGQTFDALVQYYSDNTLTDAERRMALESANRYVSTMDYVMGRDIDDGSRAMALGSSNRYLSTVNLVLGSNISAANRTLALESANRFDASIRYIVQSPLTGGERRLALNSGQTFDALVQYYSDNTLTDAERRMALESANRYVSTMDYVMGRDIDDGSRAMALGSSNRYLSTVNLVLGSNISAANRTLALESANRFDAVVRYVVDSPISGGDRRLALSAGQHYEALIGYYVDKDVSRADRTLALNSGNDYLAMIDLVLGKNLSADNRRLALRSNNRFVSIIDTVIGKKITGADRRLALNSTNLYTTVVDAIFARGISADVRTLALSNTNAIMATIDGVLARNMDGDVKTLALKKSNTFLTTLKTAMADGKLSADERRVLDAKSSSIVKTLKTGGNLQLTKDQWAVINAANGTQRLQLLADVAFGRTDLDQLENIDDNTKSLEERANDQLKELNSLVREMTLTTDQFVGLNSGITSLTKSINALGVAQAEVARIEREKKAADIEGKGRLEASRVGYARGEYNRRLTTSKSDESRLEKQISSLGKQQKNSFGRDASERKLFKDLMGDNPTKADLDRVRKIVATDTDGWINIAGAGRIRDTRVYAVLDQVEKQLQVSSDLEKARRELDRVKRELRDIRANPPASTTSELESLRRQYKNVTGKAAPFANGGIFEMGRVATNSIVSSPTLFDMGLMGEADPEAIVPLSRGEGGRLGLDATGLMRLPDGPLELPMPNIPLPQFPQLGSNDVLQVLQDVKRELQESRNENKRLQEENNRHAAAAVQVQQAGFNGQINEQKKGNAALSTMASKARLEGSRR